MKTLTIIALLLVSLTDAIAQSGTNGQAMGRIVRVVPKYDIFLSDYSPSDSSSVRGLTNRVSQEKGQERSFAGTVLSMYAPGLVSRTTTATTNVMNLLVESMKGDRKDWLQAAQQQCKFTKCLTQEVKKEDFYFNPSTKGALDPSDIKFKGFGCRSYLEEAEDATRGREEFRVYCSLRTDKEGVCSIVNHSKFLVQIDTLVFDPFYCRLPYDTLAMDRVMPFDYSKRKDLCFQLKVKIYSSWINEAIMVTTDQLLGEFTIKADIKEKYLNEDSIFVYSGARDSLLLKDGIVSVSGDCFLVPRSYTGTPDGSTAGRAWGTGEYRVEMTVTETCQVENSFYRKEEDGEQGWDRAKWHPEWETIKEKRKLADLFKQIGDSVVETYKGSNGWVQTFTEPVVTSLSESETDFLNSFLGVETTTTGVVGM